jgi:hypothetical protein
MADSQRTQTGATGRLPNDLDVWSKDFRRLQQQKHRMRGGVEARVLTNLAMYFGEQAIHQDRGTMFSRTEREEDKNRLTLVFSFLNKLTRRKIGRLWSIDHRATATPDTLDPAAYDQADVVEKLILSLNKKLKEKQTSWLRYFWLLIGGVVVEHTPWVLEAGKEPIPEFDESGELLWTDNLTQQVVPQEYVVEQMQRGRSPESFTPRESIQLVGDVASEIIDPLRFFIEAGCRSVRQLSGDQRCYIAEIKTRGWIVENFGSEYLDKLSSSPRDLDIVKTRLLDKGPALANMSLHDLIPGIQGTPGPDDEPMYIVCTGYQPPHEGFAHGRRMIFIPNHCTLDDDELQYEEIPCTDIHWEPNAVSFWTRDFLTDLIPAQKFLNKRVSQLGESANSTVYEILLLGGALSKADIPTDLPGVVEDGIDENGVPQVQSLQRAQLPGWFLETIKFVIEFLETVGGSDLLQTKKFPGQLRGSLSAPILQELLDSEDGPFYSHLGEALAQVHQQRVNRVKQFYEPIRTLHYTGHDLRDEVMVFHTSDVLRAGTEFHISIDAATLLPEVSALREARVRERLEGPMAVLYLNHRTGKIDPSKIAMDLRYTDRFRESKEAQYRKLALQLVGKLWRGIPLDPTIPLPFWDHDAVMDELETAMATTEWLDASPQTKQAFIEFHEKCRQYLQAVHDQAEQAMNARLMNSTMAQVAQQTAAKVASTAGDAVAAQVQAQLQANDQTSMMERVQQEMQAKPGPTNQPRRQATAQPRMPPLSRVK